MALTNYERQKRWRAKNRVIYNLRRRNARKGLGLGEPEAEVAATQREMDGDERRAKFEALKRELEEPEQKVVETSEEPRPTVFRNDYGAVISEGQWKRLQAKKREAKEHGYVLDEWSQ